MVKLPVLPIAAGTPIGSGAVANVYSDVPMSEFGLWMVENTWMSLPDWGVTIGIVIGITGLLWKIYYDRKE